MSTVAYLYPGSGTTPATAAQARVAPVQTATVWFAAADTTATVTHNYGFDTTAIARGCPLVDVEQVTGGSVAQNVSVTKNTNNIVLTKNSVDTNSAGTVQVDIWLPHSILMPNQ